MRIRGAWRAGSTTGLVGICLLLAVPAEARPLTLDEALIRAEAASLPMELQALSSEAAEARWLADPRAGAPSIRVGLRDLEAPADAETTAPRPEVVAKLRMPLPRPWDLATAARQGEATVAREDAELDELRARVRLAVTTRFHALPLLREAVASAAHLTDLRASHLALVQHRRDEGMATALDWLESEEARRDADDRRAERAAELHEVEAELRRLLQWPAEVPLEVERQVQLAAADVAGDLAPSPTASHAPRADADVRAAEAEIARADARLQRLQLRSLPWIDWVQGGAVVRANKPTSFEVGFAIDIPIYMWSPARTRAASQELSSARLKLEEAERDVERRRSRRTLAVAAAHERWRVESQHLDAVAQHAVPLLAVADPLLELELQARMARAEQRVLAAYLELVEAVDRAEG